MHRGRRSIAVDLKHPDGREVVLRLVDGADGADRGEPTRGHGAARPRSGGLPGAQPALAYGRMTGWGQSGPLAATAGHDIDYIALSGALSVAARRGERPVPSVNLVGDFGGGGAFLALGLVAAMWETGRSGTGPGRRCRDGRRQRGPDHHVARTPRPGTLARRSRCELRRHRLALLRGVRILGRQTRRGRGARAAVLPRAARGVGPRRGRPPRSTRPGVVARAQGAVRRRVPDPPRDAWAVAFEGSDACVAPVLSLTEAPQHPHNAERHTFVERNGICQPAPAPRFSRTATSLDRPPPAPGDHTDQILFELGYDQHDIERLRAAGAVGGGGTPP